MATKEAVVEAPKLLTIDEVIAADDIQYEEIEVKEWGGKIRIGSVTAEDMIEWVESNEGEARRTAGLRLIIKSLVDENGARIGTPNLLQVLKKKSNAVCTQIVERILTLNKLNPKASDQLKNESSEVPTGASPTVLH